MTFNAFNKETLPSHMTEERDRHYRILYMSLSLAMVLAVIFPLYAPLTEGLWSAAISNRLTITRAWTFIVRYNTDLIHFDFYDMFIRSGYFAGFANGQFDVAPIAKLMTWFLSGAFLGFIPQFFNKNKKIVMKGGYADWCDDAALKQMEARKQIGIEGGFLVTLGRWQGKERKGQMVQMIETLSALCIAPPGTGKTAAFVIPTLLSCNTVSTITNDPKPELWEATGHYREGISESYMLDWSKVDYIDPVDPSKSVFYPRFNFLSSQLVPPRGPNRDTYIDSIAKVIIPEPKGGGDSYFINKGRAAFTGFCHYLITVFGDNAGDPTFRNDLPEEWRGMEPSLPMLSDWIAHAQLENTKTQDDPDVFGGPPPSADRLGDWIRKLCEQIKPGEANKSLASPRAYNELSALVNMADKERSGVLGTMDQGLLPFKNEAVKQRTSATDFTPDDMRGVLKPEILARTRLPPDHPEFLDTGRERYIDNDGVPQFKWASDKYKEIFYDKSNWKPVSLYVCVNQSEAAAFATITSLLYEVLSNSLISFGPYEYNEKTNRILGPCAVLFVLDEFAKLPKSEAVLRGPDLGRSKRTSYFFLFQSYGQLETIYGKPEIQVLNSTTAAKLILPQNDSDTIKQLIEMVGDTTIQRHSKSTSEGLSKAANPFAWNQQENLEAVKFLRHEDIAALPPGQCIVLVQGFLNRPMKLLAPFFFLDPVLAPLVRSRGSGPMPRRTIPETKNAERIAELLGDANAAAARAAEAMEADKVYDPPPTRYNEIIIEEPLSEFEDA